MLATTARLVTRTARSNIARSMPRALSSLTINTSPKEVALEEIPRFEPSEWFKSFDEAAIRGHLAKLRDIENELVSSMAAQEESIDWDHWKSVIKYPGLVDELKQIHESMPVPDAEEEKKRLAEAAEATFAPIIAEFEKLAMEGEAETVELEKRAAEVTYLRDNLGELTVEEFLEKYPGVKASIEDDIANNRWFSEE
eukprot:GFKZ01011587.1.p1 GENE.GFKZ01011587.1~~GFKZ01011587.1.p1  ORF type:complete len:197 (+),score=46.12 GFKZ01011587.1:97-687(+)